MGIFGGIEGVKKAGKQTRGEFPQDGTYLVEVGDMKAWERQSDGQPIAVVEYTVLEIIRTVQGIEPNAEGQKCAWFNVLSRKLNGDLTQTGEYAMERVKGFAAEALREGPDDLIEDEDITEDVVDDLFTAGLEGKRFVVEVRTKTSEKSGKPFTKVFWSAVF